MVRRELTRGAEVTWYEGFDIGEFEKQEDQMIELACYITKREEHRFSGSFGQLLGISTEYHSSAANHQLNYAALTLHMQTEAWEELAAKGREHYRRLLGED